MYRIIPVYETGSKLLCSNHEPKSLSLPISNIFVKCIKNRIIEFLDNNNYFCKNQFVFWDRKFTDNAFFLK